MTTDESTSTPVNSSGKMPTTFPIDYAIVSHYSLSACPLCGENSFSEMDNIKFKYFCPRCGRFVVADSVIYSVFEHNFHCHGSKCFNYLLKKHNNMYYVNNSKIQVFGREKTDSKKWSNDSFEYTCYDSLEEEYGELKDFEDKVQYILENLHLSLPDIHTEFLIPEKVNQLLRIMFFIEEKNDQESTLETYIAYLLEDKLIEFSSEDVDGRKYKLTRKGRNMAKNPSDQSKAENATSKITIEGDYVAGDKSDFSGATILESIINPKNKSSNTISRSSENKKNKWGITKGVIASLIAAGILALGTLIATNWNSILALFG